MKIIKTELTVKMKTTVIPINVQCLDTNNFHITVNVKIGRRNEIIVVDLYAIPQINQLLIFQGKLMQ